MLVNANQIALALSFFEEISGGGALVVPDVSTYAIMMKGFSKLGMIENARKVFDEMPLNPNWVCFNTMINGYCKKGDMDQAMKIFHKMLGSKGCLPNTVTFTTLIDGFCKRVELNEAMK